MNNATTLQTNNNKLSANNTDLASILNTINNLPEAGSSSSGGGLTPSNVNVKLNNISSIFASCYSYFDENTNQIVIVDGSTERNFQVLSNSILVIYDEMGIGGGGILSMTGSADSYFLSNYGNNFIIVVGTGSPIITRNDE